MPGLHLSLGVFNRLYTLLEESCQALDLQVAYSSCADVGGETFTKYSRGLARLHTLEEELGVTKQKQETFQELLNYLLVTVSDYESNPVVESVLANAATVEEGSISWYIKAPSILCVYVCVHVRTCVRMCMYCVRTVYVHVYVCVCTCVRTCVYSTAHEQLNTLVRESRE